MKIEFRPEAQHDVHEAVAWYESERAGLGEEFELALNSVIATIEDNALHFPPRSLGTRIAIVKRFPYAVHFVAKPDVVIVFAVAHMRRSPRIWRRRARALRKP